MLKIMYVHGYNGHPNGDSAMSVKKAIEKRLGQKIDFYAPSIPIMEPRKAKKFIASAAKNYDILIASSMGAFYTMQIPGPFKIICNPAMPETLLNIVPDMDEEIFEELDKQRKFFFNIAIDPEFRYETYIVLGTEDTVALNAQLMRENYYGDHIYSLNMGHRMNDAGAEVVAEIVNNIVDNKKNAKNEDFALNEMYKDY